MNITHPKLTFKKTKGETGLAGVGYPSPPTQIKANKGICGQISYNRDLCKWIIRVTVFKTQPDSNPNCDWKWISYKSTFDTEPQARTFLENNWDLLNTNFKLYNQLGE